MFWTCFGAIFSKIFCPVFHGWSSFQKFSKKKSKKFQNSKKAQNRSKKYSNVFWTSFGANFSKKFCPVFHGVSSLRNFSKKLKKFQNSKNARNRSQKYSNVVWTSFGANFSKSFCPIFHGVSSLRNFSKKFKKFSKFQPKTHKTVPKRVQKCFEHVLGQIFRKIFKPSAPWRLETSKIFKKIKKISIFQKGPKSFPKVSKRVLNVFWGNFFEKILPSFPWRVESSKILKKNKEFSKFQKSRNSLPKVSKRVLNLFWGKFFQKKNLSQCSMEARVSENFQKSQKNFKTPKMPKIVPKSIQTCFEQVLGQIFRKLLPSSPWRVESSEIFKKIKKISIFQKGPKSFPKVSKRVLNVFWGNFFEKILPSFPWRVESSKILKKKQRIFKVPKKQKFVTKSVQTCFELVLRQIFPKKNFIPVFHGGSSLRKFSKKSKKFQNSKNAQNRSQKYPNEFWTCFGAIFSKKILPSFPWRVESSKILKKNKEFSKFQKSRNSLPKVSKRVLNLFWGKFFQKKIFIPVFHGGSSLRKFSKKSKKFQNSKNAQNRSQKYSNVFWTSFGANFSKTFAQFSMEGRVFGNFQKNSKNFQNSNQKRTKPFPKESKSVLHMFWGKFFEKILPSFPWKVESSKIFKKIKKSLKFQKGPKSFPKVSKSVWNVFWGNFFEKILPSFPWRVESSKILKKKQRIFKVPKKQKFVTKSVQTCFELVLRQIFPKKIFIPVFHGGSSLRKFSKKSKKFQNSKNAQNRSQKYSNVFWTSFGANFSKNF